MSTPFVPDEVWDALKIDDEPEVDEREAAEIAALHVEARHELTPAQDQRTSDVNLGFVDDPTAPSYFFEDEEPDSGPLPPPEAPDHELDVEEILEAQHYAFEPEPEDG